MAKGVQIDSIVIIKLVPDKLNRLDESAILEGDDYWVSVALPAPDSWIRNNVRHMLDAFLQTLKGDMGRGETGRSNP